MEYRFIHHWQYEPGADEHQVLEDAIVLAGQEHHTSYLAELAAFIARHTGARYILVGLLAEQNQVVNTCVFLKDGKPLPNFNYSLNGTPCDAVMTQRFCYYPFNITHHFPEDKELQDLSIDSYLGSILLSEDNEPVGLVALMDEKPIKNPAFAEHLILVLSQSIEEELTKLKKTQL